MGGKTTISTSETRIEALKLQSSAYGVVVPIVGGTTRIPGNLVYYNDFKAIANTTTQSSGKGGGVKTTNTTYTYQASIVMGLCHGPIGGIGSIWVGKKRYDVSWVTPPMQAKSKAVTIDFNSLPQTIALDSDMTGVWRVATNTGAVGENSDYVFAEGSDYSVDVNNHTVTLLAGGPMTSQLASTWPIIVNYNATPASYSQTALAALGLSYAAGVAEQPAPSWVSSLHASDAIGYPYQAIVYAQNYSLGSGAQVENHTFEVIGYGAYAIGSSIPDCNPADFTRSVLLDGRYGARMPADALATFSTWSSYCLAAGIVLSPAMTTQMSAADFITQMCTLTNSAPVWGADKLKIVPYGDSTLSANGATYTPNLTPLYDLTDDHFIANAGDPPVKMTRNSRSDRYNNVKIQFYNRANAYNTEIAEVKDDADISVNGLRTMDSPPSGDWIASQPVAQTVATLVMQRSLNVTAQYEFKLPWAFAMLEPMDLVTLTDSDLALNKTTVRIVSIEEDDTGVLTVTAESFTAGIATPALFSLQSSSGYSQNYNASPQSIDTTPVMFEMPVSMTVNGLGVYVAAYAQAGDTLWGGCHVWLSMDGTNYSQVGTINGAVRAGYLFAAIAAGDSSLRVQLDGIGGQITTATAAAAAANQSLLWVDGPNGGEYMNFTTATLNAANDYTLTITRGAYSNPANAHLINSRVVRVDSTLVSKNDLDLSMIGKTLYFKFTSFNVFGAGEESLATVPAYTYVITGGQAQLPPSAPTLLSWRLEQYGVRFFCAKNPEPDVVGYEWRLGPTYATAAVLDQLGGTSYVWNGATGGSFTFWVTAVDSLGNKSTSVSYTDVIPAPSLTSLTSSISAQNFTLSYSAVVGAFAIVGYEIRTGNTYAGSTLVGIFQTTAYTGRVTWSATQRWWVTPVDANGNYGTPTSVDVTAAPPGAVTSTRADVVDNNVLLYWSAPATGSLPIDRYEVRKGASWAAGTVVGSNGNSTFTTVFEQQSGTYSYWIAAWDSAGNLGTPVAITATVAQPPDYILRTSINSTFTGTLTNMYTEGGALLGPRDLTETWATHFTNHSWTSPSGQVAAGYNLYAEPSLTTGSYDETFDYGSTITNTNVVATLGYNVLDGSVSVSCQIYYKTLAGDPWTSATAGATSVLISSFRYVRVVWTFTCTAGANLIQVTSFNVKLSSKLKTDSGSGSAVSTDSGGTVVNFNIAFLSAYAPVATATGTSATIAVVNFTSTPNPTSFQVLLFDRATGNRVSGPFSWTARGY